MKNQCLSYVFLVTLLFCYRNSTAQVTPPPKPPVPAAAETETVPEKNTFSPSIQFGVGFGVNWSPKGKLFDYTLSQNGNKLIEDPIARSSFVLSTALIFIPKFTYVKLNQKKERKGEPYKSPGPLSFIVGLNFLSLNNLSNVAYNSKLGGGIGIGFNVQNALQIALMCDWTPYRKLRSYMRDSIGKTLYVGNTNNLMTQLDLSDNSMFYTEFVPSFSIKLIFNLNSRPSDQLSGIGKGENNVTLKEEKKKK